MPLKFYSFQVHLDSASHKVEEQPTKKRKSERLSSEKSKFLTKCFICGKEQLEKDQDDYYLVIVLTKEGKATIKSACKEKLPSYYLEIEDTDLIARELKYHKPCFNTFTYIYSIQKKRQLDNSGLYKGKAAQSTYEQGDFQSIIGYINKHVKAKKEAISTTKLHAIYGIAVSDSRYRSKLKTRIKNQFGEDIFCSVGRNSPDIVVSSSLSLSEVTFQDTDGCVINAAEYLQNGIM